VIVVDEDSRPFGIVTDRDIALRAVRRHRNPDETTARDIMSGELVKVRDKAPLETGIRRMRAEGLRRVPVVTGDGRVVGVLTGDIVLTLLARDLSAAAQVAHAQRALTTSA
jgi:CBS domain-containing protein